MAAVLSPLSGNKVRKEEDRLSEFDYYVSLRRFI
jgi:hypothetical protein